MVKCGHCNSRKGPWYFIGIRRRMFVSKSVYLCEKCYLMYRKYIDALNKEGGET